MNFTFDDDPLSGSSDGDLLDHESQADRLVQVLRRLQVGGSSNVVSLVGSWGSGKTSVLNRVQAKLLEPHGTDASWVTAIFNPWLFSDSESLQLGFVAALRAALPTDKRYENARKAIGGLGATISPIGKVTALWGIDSTEIIKRTSKLISGTADAASAQRKLEKELAELRLPILVILDDLDRLSPSELLQTFRLVRLVGRLPYVTYLLAYDEETLLDSLGRTDLAHADPARASEYLEKMIQVRMDMPPMRDAQVGAMFDDAITRILGDHRLALNDDSVERLGSAYWDLFVHVIRTPRALKRLFAQLDSSISLAVNGEADFVDLLFATYLRTFEPTLYRDLARRSTELTRGGGTLGKADVSDLQQRWIARLEQAHVRPQRIDGTLALLSLMFPRLDRRLAGSSMSKDQDDAIAARRGVGHADYFDRYFAYVVPSEDLADAVVAKALTEPDDSVTVGQVRTTLAADPGRVLRKVDALLPSTGDPAALLRVMEWIGVAYPEMPEAGFLGMAGRREAERFAERRLLDAEEDHALPMLRALSRSFGGLALAALIVARASKANDGRPLAWQASGTEWLMGELEARMATMQHEDIASLGPAPNLFLHTWAALDESAAKQWVRDQVDSERWDVLELAASTIGTGFNGSGPVLGDFEVEKLTYWYPLDKAIEKLRPALEVVDDRDLWTAKPTDTNRRLAVLQKLEAIAREDVAETVAVDAATDG